MSNLAAGDYTVVVTDLTTLCVNTAQGTVTDGTLTPPSPDIEILAHQTNCSPPLDPNGGLTVSVGGDVLGYIFNWYNGNAVTATPDYTGVDYLNLAAGIYTVTATDIQTGCVSEPISAEILDQTVIPEFTFTIKPANCEDSNGFIEIDWADNYPIKDVIWYDDSGQELDRATNLYDYPAADYTVEVITQQGCSNTGVATIPTEITNYNGISANGDGLNDDFQIDCITLFPNNNVKIFNRAGIKVYDRDGYDNNSIVFSGLGEKGLYWNGEELPDGTYFYIIDKGDGSRPVTGYLELIR